MNNKNHFSRVEIIVLFILFIIFITVTPLFRNEKNRKATDNSNPTKQTKKSRQTELTHETLMQYKGFENTSEAEAVKQIAGIKKLAQILFYMHLNEKENNTL